MKASATAKPPIGQRVWWQTKRLLWVVAVLATLFVLAQQIANWRGARAWQAAEKRLVAAGESRPFTELLAPPLPDSENFFATPALHDLGAVGEIHEKQRERIVELALPPEGQHQEWLYNDARSEGGSSADGQPANFGLWLDYLVELEIPIPPAGNGVSDAARFLEAYDARFPDLVAELDAASARPGAQLLPRLETRLGAAPVFGIVEPYFDSCHKLARAFHVRGRAAAQAGDAPRALSSLAILFHISEATGEVPLLLGFVLENHASYSLIELVWAGLASGAWSAEEIAQIQDRLGRIQPVAHFLHASRGELDTCLGLIESLQRNSSIGNAFGKEATEGSSIPASLNVILFPLAPRGWLDQNRAVLVDWNLDYVFEPARSGDFVAILQGAEDLHRMLSDRGSNFFSRPHTFLAAPIMKATRGLPPGAVEQQIQCDLARTACALERYRLAEGDFPEAAADLGPEHLDAIPSSPSGDWALAYSRDGSGFVLSVDYEVRGADLEWHSGPR